MASRLRLHRSSKRVKIENKRHSLVAVLRLWCLRLLLDVIARGGFVRKYTYWLLWLNVVIVPVFGFPSSSCTVLYYATVLSAAQRAGSTITLRLFSHVIGRRRTTTDRTFEHTLTENLVAHIFLWWHNNKATQHMHVRTGDACLGVLLLSLLFLLLLLLGEIQTRRSGERRGVYN